MAKPHCNIDFKLPPTLGRLLLKIKTSQKAAFPMMAFTKPSRMAPRGENFTILGRSFFFFFFFHVRFCLFLYFKLDMESPIPLFKPGSVHIGSAS